VDIPRAAGPLVHCRTNRMKLRTPPWRRLATSVLLLACASLAAAQTNADVLDDGACARCGISPRSASISRKARRAAPSSSSSR
jgi:hypothetical protein